MQSQKPEARSQKPEARIRILWDSQVKGLGLRITPRGTKSYILDYRVAMRECRATLARTSELSLKAARERAGEELAAIRAGRPHPLERRHEANAAPTVADGLDRFFNKFAPARIDIGRMTARTVKEYRKQALQYLVPALGKRKIRDVTRLDVRRRHSVSVSNPRCGTRCPRRRGSGGWPPRARRARC